MPEGTPRKEALPSPSVVALPSSTSPSGLRQILTYLPVLLGWGLFSGFGMPLFGAMFGTAGFPVHFL